MQENVRQHNLASDGSLTYWVDGETVYQLIYGDVITVIRKPA
jgi:hypothetical protein